MGRAGSPPYIASSARMNERSGRSREGAGGEKREARSERESFSRDLRGPGGNAEYSSVFNWACVQGEGDGVLQIMHHSTFGFGIVSSFPCIT